MAAVDEDSQLHAARTAVIEEGVERGADGAAGVEHVVHQDDVLAFDAELDVGRTDDGLDADSAEVVAVEVDIEDADRNLPVFESRTPAANPAPVPLQPVQAQTVKGRLGTPLRLIALAIAAVIVLAGIWLATRSTHSQGGASVASAAPGTKAPSPPVLADDGAIRIAAGSSADGYTDAWGRRWESDRYYRGGIAAPGPKELTPPVPDAGLFRTMREAVSADSKALASQLRFAYDIPVPPGSYEVRLYFASPNPQSEEAGQEDSENLHHLMIELNGQMLLWNFDPVADGVPGAMDVRAFRDVSPAADGMVHLEFLPCPERPFVSAIELIPESHGRIEPIRVLAGQSGEIEIAGNRWRGDDFFIHGRTTIDQISEPVPPPPPYFARERFGNFSYAIPVPPGSYTVKLYFMESYFSPTNPGGVCKGGEGCRVFDVTSNGVALLHNFDIFKAGLFYKSQGFFKWRKVKRGCRD